MKLSNPVLRSILCCAYLALASCTNPPKQHDAMNSFIDRMVASRHYNKAELNTLFQAVEIKDDIIKKISSPAEGMPWYKYRKIFMTEARINAGVKFWQDNTQALSKAEQQYGVPAQIIVAILGVETFYGQKTGNYRVIDALSTLAFAYPPRSQFFSSELENFLVLCKKEHLDPLNPTGSYAGAMGMPQFMPSSFLSYAIDFNHDDRADIWHTPDDAIASIGNYLAEHHWQKNQAIAVPITAQNDAYKTKLSKDLKPELRIAELESLNLTTSKALPLDTEVKLLSFEQPQGNELWAGLNNFYVITRYNHSPLYAMAVFQLSESILNKKGSFP
ncbi:Membrane-bound lytic murein transglycosylase B [Crenothrix polyspora]|uniref:Membrane-bound lytic murein transglycosylase B n=1 Tax=Crenothrix polyspora TaxID=360316 RepID=A0A1R4GYI5_9GAMM|nr:lytic murein transglycosylase B [Crenothrix polyspora]SJM89033.1 Membrane-bound lytic murein transglycosylase B [Crenothrix polyspora]